MWRKKLLSPINYIYLIVLYPWFSFTKLLLTDFCFEFVECRTGTEFSLAKERKGSEYKITRFLHLIFERQYSNIKIPTQVMHD